MRLRFSFCFIALILVVLPVASFGADAAGDRRVALVIGNNDYQYAKKLDNAVADAQAFRRELEARGFQVVYRENANRRAMNGAMEEFVGKLSTDAIGLIYYSGHGVQINGANYLIPTDLSAKAASDFAYDAVDLTKLVDRVSQTQAKFALAVIDACRDNPFQGTGRDIGGSRGLVAPSGNASGVMVVYSAGANQKALDRLNDADRNPNGLFTREFLKAMRIPGLTVQEAVNQIKMSVIAQAKSVGHVQTPAIYDQSVGTFVFTPGAPPTPAPVQAVSNSAEATRLQAELAAARAETERVKSEAAKAELGRLKADQDRARAQKEPVKQNVPVVAFVPPVPVNKVSVASQKSQQSSAVITDGYPSGKKIHMVGGGNGRRPYVGFILNINKKAEDDLVLSGDFDSAFRLYQKLDAQGDTTAAHNVGLMYIRGLGVKKDIALGMKYLEKSMADLPNWATANNYYEKAKKELVTQ